ncbi:MAG: DUF523 domain-containing protein [Gammaproteobacteria bacterium]|nr:DUF523 domain-containing protein [Gammaproteobacteria bacterium]
MPWGSPTSTACTTSPVAFGRGATNTVARPIGRSNSADAWLAAGPIRSGSSSLVPDDLRSLLAGRSIRVAVSECLLGRSVRWNGEHNGDAWPRQRLEKVFTLVGICPEVGIGMGVPRHPIQLVGEASAPRVVAVNDPNLDYTDRLNGYASEVAGMLDDVHGYIFADRSPSCGLAGVKVFAEDGSFERVGRGVYAAAVRAGYPDLPAVDAETLDDERVLLDFVLSVLTSYGVVDRAAGLRDLVRGSLNP